jgi:sarcosine oxidase subunit gamma
MADLTMQRRSPLAHLTRGDRDGAIRSDRGVRLAESPFLTMVSLRVDPATPAASRLAGVLGAELPGACGEVSEHGPHKVLWLGPDEWLVVSELSSGFLVGALTDAVEGAHAAVIDVSANRTVLELSGPAARSVLEKGCPVDLHPSAFRVGMAVATTLARIPLLLWNSEPYTYRLLPRSSFADYVARWLLDAMEEFSSDFTDGGHP